MNYEIDNDTFSSDAYSIPKFWDGIAWYVLGWETEPDENTEWSGYEVRTGNVVCIMVGDDRRFSIEKEDLVPIEREEYCGCCGQIGCCWD